MDIEKRIDGMNAAERALKRCGDIVGASLGIVLLSPAFLIIYLMQKVEGEGPAIYKQERIGLHGQPFMIYKFRTMFVDVEPDGVPQLAQEEDDRLTHVGRWLRSHHLDELPQLWNVLVGDMSFVGYRPERKYFINQIMQQAPEYEQLYVSRPGVTSYATLYNGYTDTMEKMLTRLRLDLDYLNHRSLWLDVKILCATALSMACGKRF